MHIRPESPADAAAIFGIVERAFANAPHTSHTEQHIVNALRAAGTLVVSLVAEQGHRLVGHVAFSPVVVSSGVEHWYGLGPLAVEPSSQSQGIGAALVHAGLQHLAKLSAAGCVVLGDPAYYQRFGFKVAPGLVYPGPPPEYFLARAMFGSLPRGEVTYHAAFASEA